MADDKDDSDKTEEPSARRLQQAKEKGDQVRSTELQTFIVLAGATIGIAMFSAHICRGLTTLLQMFIAQPDRIPMDPASLIMLFRNLLTHVAIILAPLIILLMVVGLVSNISQNMPGFYPDRIAPNLNKLNPLNGFKRIFGMDGLTNLFKGILKIAVVGIAIWLVLWPERPGLELVLTQSTVAIAYDIQTLFMKLMVAALACIAVIAIIDYIWQRHSFMKRNRMTKEEVKEEFKETEGDPKIKAKIRQIRNERAKKRMMAAVPKATVVVTNPTHYAVALLYESGKTPAPICVAKGVDEVAFRIRDIAKQHDVPVIENPPLARALYATVEVDAVIPPEHYKAVAQVIGYVLRMAGKLPRG